MPIEPQPNNPKEMPPERQPLWSERVFLSDGGRLRPILRVLIFAFGVFLINVEVGGAVFNFNRANPLWWQLFWSSLALAISFLLLSWIFVRLVDGRPFSSLGLTLRPGWVKELCIGFGAGVALQLLVIAILAGTRSVHYSGGVLYDLQFWKRVGMNGGLFLIAAGVEELSFRGYAFQRLIDSVGTGTAIVASAVLFGLAHIGNPGATLFSTANTVLAGIVLVVPYVRTRSMWTQIGLHWSWNLAMATIVSLPVSGMKFVPNLLLAQNARWNWLSGGNYGPEGGVVVTVVSVAGILWLAWTKYLTPSPRAQEDLQ
jgi:membrane protease YdiL (CAAX protease family)